MENSTEKTIQKRCFGVFHNALFIQGDVTIKIIQQDNGNQSRRDEFYFLIDEKEYFSIESIRPIIGEEIDQFLNKLQTILNS